MNNNKLYRNEKEYLCNLYYFFLGIVVVALLFTIATLQSDLRNNQAAYNNVVARGMYACV